MKTNQSPNSSRLALRLFSHARALLAVSALAALAVPTRSLAQAPTFNTLKTTYTGNPNYEHPQFAGVGDFNGDGKLDALVSTGSSNLRLMLGNGDGTFTQQYVSAPGTNPGTIKVVDLNGDGKLDAITVSNQGNLAATVLINTGNDASGVPQFTVTNYNNPAFGTSGLRSLTVGDLNGDGKPDFVVGDANGALRVWLNNGDGTFTGGQYYGMQPGAGGPSVGPGVIADFNGDGKADYLVTSNQNNAINIFWGNGDGTFQATPAIIPATNGMWPVVADLNHDGKPDFLAVDIGTGMLQVYLNNGNGTFSGPTLYPTGLANPCSLAFTDMNGDGKLDVVTSDYNNGSGINNVAVLLGNGDGTFGAANLYNSTLRALDLSVGDFNGDGKPDIATVGYNDDTYGVLLNTTPAALPTQTLTILGGSGNPGDIAANVEYLNPATNNWQPAYLANYAAEGHPGGHPWGNIAGTNQWINYKTDGASDPGAGPSTNQTLWYLYRVRFTVPSDAVNPKMTFSVKADNFAQVAINGVTTGGSTQFINNANVNNVIVGQADLLNADAVFSQAVHPGENTITLNVGDYGGLNGFNFRIDLSMQSSQPLTIVPAAPADKTPPVITAPADIIKEATSAAGAVVTFAATATDNVDGSVPVVANPASGSTFPIATTIVGLAASDKAGNTASASFKVTVQDTTPPALTVPPATVAEATSANGATVSYPAATASDAVGVASIVYSQNSSTQFPLGNTTVSVTAKDAANNATTLSFNVTVRDTTAPMLTLPANQTLEATSPAGAVATFSASATDAVTASPTITYSAASGSTFALGNTTVNVSAKDAAGNTSSGSFTITVRDTTPPVIAAKADVVAEATSAVGAIVTFSAPTATDIAGAVTVTTSPASGSQFALGATVVKVTATDASNNSATSTFNVIVKDTTAPKLTLPANLTVEATSPAGAVATFSASATDAVTASPTITYSKASGSTFPIGNTTILVTATDAAGNSSTGSFTVTVRDTTAPKPVASLVSVRGGGDDESTQSFTVTFSATDLVGVKTLTASLNGVTVTNGQVVQLQTIKSGAQSVKRDDGKLQIKATSFLLTVTATDAAGNSATATAVPVFNKNGKDSEGDKNDDHKDNNKSDKNNDKKGG